MRLDLSYLASLTFFARLGWLVYAIKNRNDLFGAGSVIGSVDLNMPEAIAFRSVFAQVHFAIGIALLCYSIKLFFTALVENKMRRAFWAGLLGSLDRKSV